MFRNKAMGAALFALLLMSMVSAVSAADAVETKIKRQPVSDEYIQHVKNRTLKPAPRNVIISEFCFWPREGESEWVKLTNTSTGDVDISGWLLLDGVNLEYELPAEVPLLKPGQSAIVIFDGKAGIDDADGNGPIRIHSSAKYVGDIIPERTGHLLLYSKANAKPKQSVSRVRSYIAWGHPHEYNWPGCMVKWDAKGRKADTVETKSLRDEMGGFKRGSRLAFNPEGKKRGKIVITEICSWPAADESESIEIVNYSKKDVDVSGWIFEDGQRLKCILPKKMPKLSVGGRLVVIFESEGKKRFEAEGNRLTVHMPLKSRKNVLGDNGGSIRFSSPDPKKSKSSYAAWGAAPSVLIEDAINGKCLLDWALAVEGRVDGAAWGWKKKVVQGGSYRLKKEMMKVRPLIPECWEYVAPGR